MLLTVRSGRDDLLIPAVPVRSRDCMSHVGFTHQTETQDSPGISRLHSGKCEVVVVVVVVIVVVKGGDPIGPRIFLKN